MCKAALGWDVILSAFPARAEGSVTFTFTDPSGKVVKTQDASLGSRRRARSLLQRRRTRTATITVQPGLLGRVTVTASFTPRNNRGRPARAPPIIIVIVAPPSPGGPVIIKCAPCAWCMRQAQVDM